MRLFINTIFNAFAMVSNPQLQVIRQDDKHTKLLPNSKFTAKKWKYIFALLGLSSSIYS